MGISTNKLEGKSFIKTILLLTKCKNIVKHYAVLTLMILRELSSI